MLLTSTLTPIFCSSSAPAEIVRAETNGLTRTEIHEIRDPATDRPVKITTRQFHAFAWGEGLISETFGAGPGALTNTFDYYPNGLLKLVQRHDGSWEHYEYDERSRARKIFSAFGNQAPTNDPALCRLVEMNYSLAALAPAGDDPNLEPNRPRRTVEYLLGHEVSRAYCIVRPHERIDIQCQTAGAAFDAPDNFFTTNRFWAAGPDHGKLKAVLRSNGSCELYEYRPHPQGTLTIVSSGWPDAPLPGAGEPASILKGISRITLNGPVGELLARTNLWISPEAPRARVIQVETFDNSGASDSSGPGNNSARTILELNQDCCGGHLSARSEPSAASHGDDALLRQVTTMANGVVISNRLDAAGNVIAITRQATNGQVVTLVTQTFDTAGRLASTTDALGHTTTYTYGVEAGGGRLVEVSLPDGGTRIQSYYRDGSLFQVRGNATFPLTFTHGIEGDGAGRTNTFFKIERGQAGEWTKTYTDMLGRRYRTVYPGDSAHLPCSVTEFYDTGYDQGRIKREVDPDGVVKLYSYNYGNPLYTLSGDLTVEAIDQNRDGVINATDRITETLNEYVADGATTWRQVTQSLLTETGLLEASVTKTDLHGGRSQHTQYGLTSMAQSHQSGPRTLVMTNTEPDQSYLVSVFQDGQPLSERRFNAAGEGLGGATYDYDLHGRLSVVTDARSGRATTFVYDPADRILSTTISAPGLPDQVTRYGYDPVGRVRWTVYPEGRSVTNEYYPNGLLKTVSGAGTLSSWFAYDYTGRLTNMITPANAASGAGPAATSWKYDARRGFLVEKRYADGKGPTFAYTDAGRLAKRTWARGVETAYAYDSAGDLAEIHYSDDTPSITNIRDQLGRIIQINQGTNTYQFQYTPEGQLARETIPNLADAALPPLAVASLYDALGRRVTNGLVQGNHWLAAFTSDYDSASRVRTVSDGTHAVHYSYLTNSSLVDEMISQTGGENRMRTIHRYDTLDRLVGITSTPGAGRQPYASFAYDFASAPRNLRVAQADGGSWSYTSDALGRLTHAAQRTPDGPPVSGRRFEYVYDELGNRTRHTVGGQEPGQSASRTDYTANLLNQYVQAITTESLHSQPRTDWGDPERRRPVAVSPAPKADDQPSSTSPATSATFSYDADGNLTNDGRWHYTWDAENRLVQMETVAATPAETGRKLAFSYDYSGRRMQKEVFAWNPSQAGYELSTRVLFAYDGWNLLAMLDGRYSLLQSFMWGPDRHGATSAEGAGIGGLLARTEAGQGTWFYAYDGLGNTAASIRADDGAVVGQYAYGPFGEPLATPAPHPDANPFRFSTMFHDEESGLVYFGLRYYDPRSGRWLARDPLEEEEGANLYTFSGNHPMFNLDNNGAKVLRVFYANDASFRKPDHGQEAANIEQDIFWVAEQCKRLVQRRKCAAVNPGLSAADFNLIAQVASRNLALSRIKPRNGLCWGGSSPWASDHNLELMAYRLIASAQSAVPVLVTKYQISAGGFRKCQANARATPAGITIASGFIRNTFAHELGHFMGYVGETGDYHSQDPFNLMYPVQDMQVPDCRYCGLLSARVRTTSP